MIYIKKFKVFVPSEEAPQPDVKFVPMLTRRRLSLLSKMVVFVNDAVSKDLPPCKVTFASQYGEISQQLKISDTLLQTGNVSPAHFSLSVFNASIANATILEKNTAGYSAVFSLWACRLRCRTGIRFRKRTDFYLRRRKNSRDIRSRGRSFLPQRLLRPGPEAFCRKDRRGC